MKRNRGTPLAGILLATALAWSSQALGDPLSPFQSVGASLGPIPGEGDAASVGVHPARLGWLRGPEAALIADYGAEKSARPMRGLGLFVGTPLFGGLSLGAGLSYRRPGLLDLSSNYVALDLGFALRMGKALSVGGAWDRILSGSSRTRGSFTLGADVRLGSALALGGRVVDLNRPTVVEGGPQLPRQWNLELGLRPLLDGRAEIALGTQLVHLEKWHALWHGRMESKVLRGTRLFGEVRQAISATPGVAPTTNRKETLALLGLRLEWGKSDIALAGVSRVWGDPGVYPGLTIVGRVHSDARETAVPSPYVAQLQLKKLHSERAFLAMLLELKRLAQDPNVAAILLRVDDPGLGLARIEELRMLIRKIRTTKRVLAQLQQTSFLHYYLASACSDVVMDPAGSLFLGGLKHQVTYFKSALDRLGVGVDVERIAEHKGAMEPFMQDGPSEAVRENHNALLDEEFASILAGIGQDRGLAEGRVRALIDRAVFSPTEANAAQLVDEVSDDEPQKLIERRLGRAIPVRDAETPGRIPPAWSPKRVAVVLIDGALVDGDPDRFPFQGDDLVWSEPVVALLDRIRKESSIGAVVLRINSPGGSSLASDLIARAVARLRKAGKPVVASMSDVAASGGYYIAAPANWIFADPSTLTGSIGIYAYKADVGNLMGRLGISASTLRRGEKADLFSLYRPWTAEERKSIALRIGDMYQRFVATVVEGRKDRGVSFAAMESLGGGRLWTGGKAREKGLVDDLGGIADALRMAAQLANLRLDASGIPEILVLPKPARTLLDLMTGIPLGRSMLQLMAPMMVENGAGFSARLPYLLEVH